MRSLNATTPAPVRILVQGLGHIFMNMIKSTFFLKTKCLQVTKIAV